MIKAKYTVVLKTLLDSPEVKPLIDKALSKYPLYESKIKREFIPAYIPTREQLNQKILNHYKYHEIGLPTVGQFLDELEIVMDEIMPEYNLLYYSADLDYDPLTTVDWEHTTEETENKEMEGSTGTEEAGTSKDTTATTGTATDSTTTTSTVTSHTKQVQTNTPQSQIGTPAESIDSIDYADSVNWGKDSSSSNGSSTSNGNTSANSTVDGETSRNSTTETEGTENRTTSRVERFKGDTGVTSSAMLIKQFRQTILNIDKQIIENQRIRELFMLVY